MTLFRLSGLVVTAVCAVLIAIVKPFAGLPPQGHLVLAAFLVTLSLWIFRPPKLPYFAGGALLLGSCLAFRVPLPVVTAGYASSALWVLIPALFFGYALAKTGLGNRIAYAVLKLFEPSYPAIVLSWFIIGIALSALTPSITVRLSIIMPIAMSVVEACGIPDRSRGSALICLSAWGTAVLPGTGWLTGSLWGIFMMGFYPAEMKPLVTFDAWFLYMALPWFLITVLFLGLLYVVLRPKERLTISKETFHKQYAQLGPITRQEALTAVILLGALVLFATDRLHGLPTAAVALLTLFALIMSGILEPPEISTGVNWDIINFFGVVVGLTGIFVKTGISDWARPFIEPAILAWAPYPIYFLLVVTIGFWVVRFVDVPWGFATIALAAPLFIPLYREFGLHPAFVSVAVIAAGNSFFLPYQQPFILIAEAGTKSRAWAPGHVTVGGVVYAVSVIAAILISSFYWKAMGLIP